MGFKRVYKSLQELFPQIDARVLRAVAIEHSKDVDEAADAVLTEIIPFFTEQSEPTKPSNRKISIRESSEGAIAPTQTTDQTYFNTGNQQSFHDATDEQSERFYDTYDGDHKGEDNAAELTLSGNIHGETTNNAHSHSEDRGEGNTVESTSTRNILRISGQMNIDVHSDGEAGQSIDKDWVYAHETEVSAAPKIGAAISDDKYPERKIKIASDIHSHSLGASHDEDNIIRISGLMNIDVHSDGEAGQSIDKDWVNAHETEVSAAPKIGAAISDDKYPERKIKIASDIHSHSLGTSHDEDSGTNQAATLFRDVVDNGHLENEFGSATDKESDQVKSYRDGNNSIDSSVSLTVHDPTRSPIEIDSQLSVNITGSGFEELDACLANYTASEIETASNIVGNGDESILNAALSQSNQINIIAALEEIISDARNNKKTLFSSMESVINLMKEVELKEQAAEQAKTDAAMGGMDILVKSEELKQMVQQAEEMNAMRSGEVYGEKAILATELRELQSRVLSLSEERDKSLAVLDEMRQTLEVRLAEAKNEIESAEQEKVEKEKAAMKALADQELIMENVVEESKILKQQAADNAKLREFLVDRGRVVDMLQGEIAVICQDVRLLKQKFDDHVPFSKSLSSSQTSCILASSASSSKSLNMESLHDLLGAQKGRGAQRSSSEQSFEGDDAARDNDHKALSDDGWELFDNREIF